MIPRDRERGAFRDQLWSRSDPASNADLCRQRMRIIRPRRQLYPNTRGSVVSRALIAFALRAVAAEGERDFVLIASPYDATQKVRFKANPSARSIAGCFNGRFAHGTSNVTE